MLRRQPINLDDKDALVSALNVFMNSGADPGTSTRESIGDANGIAIPAYSGRNSGKVESTVYQSWSLFDFICVWFSNSGDSTNGSIDAIEI